MAKSSSKKKSVELKTAATQTVPVEVTEGENETALTIGQLGMWLFISTEVMFFAAIVAAYLVFRFSTLGVGWPTATQMHASMPTGILNTVILVVSGVAAWSMYNAAQANRSMAAKLWLILTMVLGFAFLGIKSSEYYHKFEVGLMPVAGKQQIFNEANRQYVSAVDQRLKSWIAKLESKSTRLSESQESLSESEKERLEQAYQLKQYMSEATAKTVGLMPGGPLHAQLSMNLLAYQIMPHPDTERNVEEVLEPEMEELRSRFDRITERRLLIYDRQELIKRQIEQMEGEISQMQLLNPDDEEDKSLIATKKWLETKQDQQTALTAEAKRMESFLEPVAGRIDNLVNTFGAEGPSLGINEKHDFRLPVVITNGQSWMSIYLLLTGAHVLHLIAGLMIFIWWLPRKLSEKRAPAIYVTCMFWQFVDVVWLCIFWLIYF